MLHNGQKLTNVAFRAQVKQAVKLTLVRSRKGILVNRTSSFKPPFLRFLLKWNISIISG